jgi:hypothetical protein
MQASGRFGSMGSSNLERLAQWFREVDTRQRPSGQRARR